MSQVISGILALGRRLPYPLRAVVHLARRHARVAREQGIEAYARWLILMARLAWKRRRAGHVYHFVSEAVARRRRRADTVFVFGSGYSLNALSPQEWAHFADHDVLGFSGFVYQRWVRVDFHLIRGWDYGEPAAHRRWRRSAVAYAARIRGNPHFADTLYVMQDEYGATTAHALIGGGLLPVDSSIVSYRTADPRRAYPSRTLAEGLCHTAGTLSDAVNFAYVLGWTTIVLVGVDLYDSRYFWAPSDATVAFDASGEMVPASMNFRGTRAGETHPTVRNGVVDVMERWARIFAQDGIRLSVYNPRSLLADVMPVYDGFTAARGEKSSV